MLHYLSAIIFNFFVVYELVLSFDGYSLVPDLFNQISSCIYHEIYMDNRYTWW